MESVSVRELVSRKKEGKEERRVGNVPSRRLPRTERLSSPTLPPRSRSSSTEPRSPRTVVDPSTPRTPSSRRPAPSRSQQPPRPRRQDPGWRERP